MSTSNKTIALEAAGAAALVVGAVALASPDDLWLGGTGFHPAWLPVMVLAARYGTRGLFASLAITLGLLIGVDLVLGGSLSGLEARGNDASDLMALAASVMIAWIAMLHESRIARATSRLAESTELQHQAEETVKALHDSLSYLRTRHDRIDVSLSLWRDFAARLERGDASEAATAVLELCAIRVGAVAGVVQLRDGNRFSTLARRGQWSALSARPRDIPADRTVASAVATKKVTPANEVQGATETDSDVAVPVLDDGSGVALGVIALRGVSPRSLRAADISDLAVIAQWLAPALGRPSKHAGAHDNDHNKKTIRGGW